MYLPSFLLCNRKVLECSEELRRMRSILLESSLLSDDFLFNSGAIKEREQEDMYSYDDRVRFSEADKDGYLRLEGILDYFQDCSTFQSEDLDVGMQYLDEFHLVWVLSSWQIVVERYPKMGERIKIGTVPYSIKGCFGHRNYMMFDEKGERIACANALWTLLDTRKMIPAKPTALMLQKYLIEEKIQMDYAPRKITMPDNNTACIEEKEKIVVKKYHLDSNNHVNNGQYVRMAMDFLPETVKVVQMRAEYKKQAHLDDIIIPVVGRNGDVSTISLNDTSGDTYACIEFTTK